VAFAFKQIEAHDPNNPGLVAPNAMVTIFEPGDPAKTPLTLTTLTGEALANPVTVNGLGYGPAFMHATLPQVAWSGGGLTGTFESYQGMRDEAIAARDAAENAASNAAAAQAAAEEASDGLLPANPDLTVTYNPDGSVASTTENGVLTTFTYNTDGTVDTQTRNGVTKTYTYDANGNVTGAA